MVSLAAAVSLLFSSAAASTIGVSGSPAGVGFPARTGGAFSRGGALRSRFGWRLLFAKSSELG